LWGYSSRRCGGVGRRPASGGDLRRGETGGFARRRRTREEKLGRGFNEK